MKPTTLAALVDPVSRRPLSIKRIDEESRGEIKEGVLTDGDREYRIRNFIPRFVVDDDIAAHWGEQWNHFRKTQIDSESGRPLSRERLVRGTGWTLEELRGQRILEVGCGAGRFTQVLLDAGAEVVAFDYSNSVEACLVNNNYHPSLTVLQADLFRMPFPENYFDKVFCYGVLQYTPDPKGAFMALIPFLKPGGRLSADVYLKTPWVTRWTSKHWWRPLTKRMPRPMLFQFVNWYIPKWIPWDNFFQRIPVLRRIVPAIIPCWNYTGMLSLSPQQVKEWAILDTFSALAPWYDSPQTLPTVAGWVDEAGLSEVDVRYGSNGVIGNGSKLAASL